MDTTHDSFELKTTMSPNNFTKRPKEIRKKAPTRLALKKTIRRSSIFDRLKPSIKNVHVKTAASTETETSESAETASLKSQSTSTTSTSKSLKTKFVPEEGPIVIYSSEDENVKDAPVRNEHLSETKFESIKNWIQGLDGQKSEKKMVPDTLPLKQSVEKVTKRVETEKMKPPKVNKPKKQPINSTFLMDKTCLAFDKWMLNTCKAERRLQTPKCDKKTKESTEENKNIRNVCDQITNDVPKLISEKKQRDEKLGKENVDWLMDACRNMGASAPKAKSLEKKEEKVEDFVTPSKQLINNNDDVANLLDKLYGNSWHKNKEQIFSEPKRPSNKIQIHKLKEPRTEQKTKRQEPREDNGQIYRNPYLDSERQKSSDLLKRLQQSRIQANVASPFFARPKCVDSPSPPAEERHEKKNVLTKPVKLNFNNDKPDKKTKGVKVSSSSSDSDFVPSVAKGTKGRKLSSTSSASTNSKQSDKSDKNDLVKQLGNITLDESSGSDSDFVIKTRPKAALLRKTEPKQFSFLASLSKNVPIDKCDPSALIYRNNYKQHREALTKKLFGMFNENIFDKKIPEDTAIEWSARMTGTAGYCVCTKKTHRDKTITRSVRIQLSTKVSDAADRLRDTLVHEMCHAATYIVNEVNDGHGPFWKSWASKAMKAYPELPAIKRCHDYDINYKYTYKCTQCSYSFGRHSKSLNLEKKRCGHCYGRLEVLLNKTSQRGTLKSVPCTPKKEATGFALYVKENYALHKSPSVKHADLMKLLGRNYQASKGDSANKQ